MSLAITPLSAQHTAELSLAVDRALAQWAKGLTRPEDIVAALERVLLFLRQNGAASPQARHVASLAFSFGQQVVAGAGWTWQSVSDDGGVNPSIVSPDGTRAVLVVDVMTRLVVGADKASLASFFQALLRGEAHPLVTPL
ncbi:MAG: hypothetical protein AB1938_10710 [Myxococcota bacterium]